MKNKQLLKMNCIPSSDMPLNISCELVFANPKNTTNVIIRVKKLKAKCKLIPMA